MIDAICRRLRSISSLFVGLDGAATTLVVKHLKRVVLAAGHVVFEDNAPGDTLYHRERSRTGQ